MSLSSGTCCQGSSPTELEFTGIIRTQIKDINNDAVCERKGTYHFIAKGSRKYWRFELYYSTPK